MTGKPTQKSTPEERIQALQNRRMLITKEGLKQLAAYQYKSAPYTPLDNFMTTYWWNKVINYLPMWIAPNLVTLIGMLTLLVSYGVISYHCPTYSETAPSWVYACCAVGIFVYQTMDAVDGKQARRTGTSSPLGQLFDHGCDCCSTAFIALSAAASVQLGPGWKTMTLLFFLQGPFFLAQWEEYHTHTFRTAAGPFGVTEAQVLKTIVHTLTAIFGPWLWKVPVVETSSVSLNLGEFLLLCTCITTFYLSLNCLIGTFTAAKHKLTAFLQLVPLILLCTCGALWCQLGDLEHPRLTMLTLGGTYTYLISYMILCAMTKMEYPLWGHAVIYPLPVVFAILYWDLLPRHKDVVLGGYLCFTVHKLVSLLKRAIEEITTYLDLNVLTIPYEKVSAKSE